MPNDRERGTDPTATVGLLWGDTPRRTRGPKPSLSVAKVVHAAIVLADEEGLDAVTMRRVAQHLGVTTMAPYRYVPGKDELLALMVDTAVGEPPGFDDVAGDWRRGLTRWARRRLGVYRRHPWMLEVATDRHLMGPNETAWLDAGLGTLADLGLDEGEMVQFVLLVGNYVRGCAQTMVARGALAPDTPTPDGDRSTPSAALVARLSDPSRYPMVARAVSAGAFPPPGRDTDVFLHGLECILDGIEVTVQHAFVPGVGRVL